MPLLLWCTEKTIIQDKTYHTRAQIDQGNLEEGGSGEAQVASEVYCKMTFQWLMLVWWRALWRTVNKITQTNKSCEGLNMLTILRVIWLDVNRRVLGEYE